MVLWIHVVFSGLTLVLCDYSASTSNQTVDDIRHAAASRVAVLRTDTSGRRRSMVEALHATVDFGASVGSARPHVTNDANIDLGVQKRWRKDVLRREVNPDGSLPRHHQHAHTDRGHRAHLAHSAGATASSLMAAGQSIDLPGALSEIGIAPLAYRKPMQEFLLGAEEEDNPDRQATRPNKGTLANMMFIPLLVGVPSLCIFTVVFVWLANRSGQGQDNLPAARVLSSAQSSAVADRHIELRRRGHSADLEDLERLAGTKVAGVRMTNVGDGTWGLDSNTQVLYKDIFGLNKLTPPEQESPWVALFRQIFGGLFNGLLWVCVAAQAFLALIAGEEMVTPIILAAVVVGSATLQWWTEQKAQSMMDSLMNMQAAEELTIFRRARGEQQTPPEQLLPGDIILLTSGMKVPADLRVLDCTDGALVENSALTGESAAEPRSSDAAAEGSPFMEARNVLFSGTSVVEGRLLCVVIAIGDNTMLGNIAAKCRTARPISSLEIQIEHFVHIIAVVAISVGFLSLMANYMSPRRRSTASIFRNTATAVFAQVPEGLLPTVTVSLMIAAEQMRDRNMLVRKIDAIETLGCISVLCSDKTGTLTSGYMTATDFVVPGPSLIPGAAGMSGRLRSLAVSEATVEGEPEVARLAQCGVLNSTAKLGDDGVLRGSPTEVAIGTASQKALGLHAANQLRDTMKTVFDIPFSSSSKWMLTVHAAEDSSFRLILKGASEKVLDRCSMPDETRKDLDNLLEELMSQGKRVLCIAQMMVTDKPADYAFKGSGPDDANFPLTGYTFCGLVAIEDPPKDGVPESIARLREAGCTTIMVTGDHPSTAKAIAKRIGITTDEDDAEAPRSAEMYRVITGEMLEQNEIPGDTFDPSQMSMDLEEAKQLVFFWEQCVKYTRVFARVSPMHKRSIVRAYQQLGSSIVGMTGDGVNDAPALKEAEVGIAMGIRGTEVAKEAADIVLIDDDLRSVVTGVEQGRLCSENLRKSIKYTLCSKIPQLMPNFAETFGVPTALTAVQVLLIDIGTDIWTAIAYAWQPMEDSLMAVRPRHPRRDRMVNGEVLLYSYVYIGSLQMAMCWIIFFQMPKMLELATQNKAHSLYDREELEAQDAGSTMYYWVLVCGQVGAGLATTTSRQSLFKYGLPNMKLNWCIVAEILLGIAVIYWTPANEVFKTRPLDVGMLCVAFSAIVVIVFLEEMRKFYLRSQPD